MIQGIDIEADALEISGGKPKKTSPLLQSLLAPDKTGLTQIDRDAYEASRGTNIFDLAADAPVRLVRGSVRGAGLAASGVGALGEAGASLLPDAIAGPYVASSRLVQRFGAGIDEVAPRGDPRLDQNLISQGIEGVGTSALPILAGVATGGLGLGAAGIAAAAGGTSVAMEAGSGFTEAQARGGTRGQALQAAVLTAPAGLLDVVELGSALRIARGVRGAGRAVDALERAATVLDRAGTVGGVAGSALAEGLQETAQGKWEQSVQEMVGTIANEEDARSMWDIAQQEGMPGGVAGAMMEAVTRYLARGMGRKAITDRGPEQAPLLSGIPGLGAESKQAGGTGPNAPEGAPGGAPPPAPSSRRIELPDDDLRSAIERYDAARAPTEAEREGPRVRPELYEASQPMRDRGSLLGARVALFDVGEKSKQPGFYDPETRTILIDRNASPQEQERALFDHEVVHFMATNHLQAFDGLAEAINDLIPASDPTRPKWLDWYSRERERMARESAGGDPQNAWSKAAQKRGFDFAANHPLPVTPQGPILTPGVAREEAVAGTIEQLPTLHDFVRNNRNLAVRVATHRPGVFRRLTDALRDFAVKLGLAKDRSISALLRELDALLGKSGTALEKGIGASAATAIVLKFQALEDSLATASGVEQPTSLGLEQPKGLEIPQRSAGAEAFPSPLFDEEGELRVDESGKPPSLPVLRDLLAKTEEGIARNRGEGKQAKRRKKLERRAAELRDAVAVLEREERQSTPKEVGDRVRLQSGEEGTVTSVKGDSLKVFVPERKFGDPDTTLGIPEPRSRTVSASSVELIEKSAKAPTRTPLPVSRPQAREATAAQPTLSKEDLRTDPDAQAVIQMGRNAQSGYLGHKGAFVGRFVALLKKLFRNSLSDVESIFDVYSGGGSYGLSYATTGLMPKLKRIVLNEFNPHRLARLRLALDSGAEYMDEWNTNPSLVSLRAALIPLMGGSASPAQRSLATVLGEKDGTIRPEFLKWQESVANGSPRVRAAVVSMLDVMVGGYTADWSRAFEKATTDANKLQSMARTVKAQGATIELTSLDSRSPEMLQRVRAGGRSLVLSDSPYHGTSSGAYSGSGKREDFASTENMKLFAEAARKMASGNVLVFHNSATPEVRAEMDDLFDGNIAVHEWIRSKKANAKAEYLGVYDGSRTSDYDGGRVSDDRTAARTGQVVQDAGVLGDSGRHAERQTDAGAVGYASRARSERAARGELPVRVAAREPARVAPPSVAAALPVSRQPVPEPMPLLATTLLLPERAQSIVERQQALTTPRRSFLPIKPIALTQRAGAPAVQILVGDTVSVTQKDGRVHEGVVTEATGFGNVQRVRVKGLARPVDMERVTLVKRAGRVTPEQSVLREEAREERRLPIQPRFATREIDPLGFYSRLLEQIAALPDPVKASTALSKLKANVSAEEMEWSNIERNLRAKQPDEKISHEDLRYVMSKSPVADIEEAQLTGESGGDLEWEDASDVRVRRSDPVYVEPPEGEEFDEETAEETFDVTIRDTDNMFTVTGSDWTGSWWATDEDGHGISDDVFKTKDDAVEAIQEHMFERAKDAGMLKISGQTKYDQYQTPGGTNYREILLRLPRRLKPINIEGWRAVPNKHLKGAWIVDRRDGVRLAEDIFADTEAEAIDKAREDLIANDGGRLLGMHEETFTGGHFDEANVLVHMRVNDRQEFDTRERYVDTTGWTAKRNTEYNARDWSVRDANGELLNATQILARNELDAISRAADLVRAKLPPEEGKKVLHVEEIQSDWHQKGRERGYRGDVMQPPTGWTAEKTFDGGWNVYERDGALRYQLNRGEAETQGHAVAEAWRQLNADTARGASLVPNAPFKDTWPELAMKRLLTIAAQEGYQKLAWTTAAQQIDRYNEAMRQNVDKIEVEPRDHYVPRVVELEVDEGATGRAARPFAVELGGGVPNGRWTVLNTFNTREEADGYARGVARQSTVYIRAHKSGQEKFGAEVPLEGETTIHGHKVALEDVVGKDIARKIKEKPGEKQTFEGDGLAIGGKGMQAFYDKRLRDIAKKLTKNEPHTIELPTRPSHYGIDAQGNMERTKRPARNVTVHAVDVPTEAIKAQGFARFATAGQIDSASFRKWFGDSKMVNRNGTPRVFYHGTGGYEPNTRVFHTFDKRNFGGIFFSPDPDEQYSMNLEDVEPFVNDGSRIFPVYLKAENPYFYNGGFESKHGFTGDMMHFNEGSFGGWLKEHGYDALIQMPEGSRSKDPAKAIEIIVWNSAQVKSAIGNRGTFSLSNPDIRFATRGESDYSEFFKQQRADIRERMKRIASGESELDRPLANPARSKRARQFAEAVQEMRKESLSDDMRHTWERAQAEFHDLEESDPHGVKTLDKLLHGEALSEAETLQAQRLKEDAQREGFQAGPNALQKHAEAVALEYHYAAARAQASGILRNVRDRFRTKQERFLASLYGPNMDAMRRARKAKTPEARDKILAKEVAKIQRALFALADAGFSPSMLTDDYFADDQTAARMADIAARAKGDFWDWFYAWRASAMQASTLSWARNITSNSAHIAFDNVFAKALSSTPAETKAYVYDMISAVPDAMKAGYATWRWGIHEGTSVDEIQKAPGWLGLRVLEKLGVDANAGADVYFRHIVATAELRAAARFLSKKEGRPIEDYLDSPELIERAEDAGLYSTFANRDRFTGALQALRSIADIGGFSPGKLIVPFIATPTRLVVRGLEVAAGPVPPLVRIGLKDMAQDQKLREMGKALAGLGVWAAVYALANATHGDDDQPWITGARKLGKEGEQQERTAPAYSVWNPFSQSYLSYQNIDPFATALAIMVDVLQGNRSLPASFASTVKDKSFFRGVQMAYDAATDEAGGKLGRYARGTLVDPMIPNIARSALPKAEPTARREITRTDLEALEPRRLGFSATGWPGWAPPPKFDRWGRPVAKAGRSWFARWFDMLPRTREAGEIEHIDILLSRYRDVEGKAVAFGAPSYQFDRSKQTIVMTEDEYSELSRDSGLAAIGRLRPWASRKQELKAQDIEHIRSVIRESESAIKDRIWRKRRTPLPVTSKDNP